MSDETAKLLADIHIEAEKDNPYIFISRDIFKRTQYRIKTGRWNPKSEVVNKTLVSAKHD